MRSALALGLCVVLLALWPPVPASAHGSTIAFTVVGDGAGGVRAAGVWTEDGHPVDVPVIVLLTAVSEEAGPAGTRQVGPVRMTVVPGRGSVYEARGALPPGRWRAIAESAVPSLGRGQAVLDVGTVATGYPADFPPPVADGPTRWDAVRRWLGSVAVCVVVAGGALALVLRARRQGVQPVGRPTAGFFTAIHTRTPQLRPPPSRVHRGTHQADD
ncbi:hypothetical protein R8Z50_23800 [Longispora sp. K20-0274]|uniref:hypothetical protein n=1 Tax=Longispora sp. K20-0274 TaxID=3088255 RepID=UPI00399BB4F7